MWQRMFCVICPIFHNFVHILQFEVFWHSVYLFDANKYAYKEVLGVFKNSARLPCGDTVIH